MAKYTKSASGIYRTTIELGHDATGKRIRKDIKAKSKKELEEKLEKFQKKSDYTLGEYAKVWIEVHKKNVQDSTRQNYENIINNHINDLYDLKMDCVSLTDVQTAINEMTGHWDIQRRIKLTLNQIYECAIEDGVVGKNPVKKAKVPKKPSAQAGRVLTEEEKEKLKKLDLPEKEIVFVMVARYTGMRPEEIRGLKKKDFDLENNTVTVGRAISYASDDRGIVKEPKTESGYRTIPIVNALKPHLEHFLPQVDDWLFTGERTGKPLYKTSYRRMWNRVRKQLGTNITPYVFRHEFATQLYYSGIDLKYAKQLMGHSDIRMILEVYSHLDKKKTDSEKLNSIKWD